MTDQRAHTTRRRETALRVRLTRVRVPATQDWHQSDDSWRGAVRRGTGTGLGRRLTKASSGRHDRHVSYRVDLMAATTVT